MALAADDFLTVRRIKVFPILLFNFKGSVKGFISPFACIGEEVGLLIHFFYNFFKSLLSLYNPFLLVLCIFD